MAVPCRYEQKYFLSFVWGLVIAADLIAISFFLAGQRNMHRYMDNDFNGDIIRDFEQAKKETDISIIMLGNSRLRHAAMLGFDPAKPATLPDGRTLTSLQFALNAGRFELYENIEADILRARPDLIVIQDSVISNASGAGPTLVKISFIVYDYFRKLVTNYDEYQEWQDDRRMILVKCDVTLDARHMAQRRAFMEKDHHALTEDNASYRQARRFLRQARENGIKVVVLSLHPYTALFEKYNMPRHLVDFHGLGFYPEARQLLPDLYNDVTWENYKAPDEPAHFCDEVHLNKEGRRVFTDWFLNRITAWIPGN